MKKLWAVLLTLLCAACAPVTKVSVPDLSKSDAISVSDVRPADEKDRKLFALLITSKEYGIFRVGDGRFSPPPLRLLQHQVYEQLKAADHPLSITVHHFVIYTNARSQLRAGAIGAGIGGIAGGLIGNAVANHDSTAQTRLVDSRAFENSSGDEYQRGLYTESEDPQKASVYIIYIDTDMGGKRVFTRTIAPARNVGDQDSLVNAVQLAIKNQLSNYSSLATSPLTSTSSGAAPTTYANPASSSPSTSSVVASTASSVSSAGVADAANAQAVANQMGCGAVQPGNDNNFVAQCSGHDVLIGCDSGQCRPLHIIRGSK